MLFTYAQKIIPLLICTEVMSSSLLAKPVDATKQTAAVLAPINQLVDAINQTKPTLPAGIFTADAVVIDEFAPFRWTGNGAAPRWYGELVGVTLAARAAFVAQHAKLAIGVPVTFKLENHTAYVVVPGTFEYDENGEHFIETSQWAFNCVERGGHWLVAGNAWALMRKTPTKTKGSAAK